MCLPDVTHDDRAAREVVALVGIIFPQLARNAYNVMSVAHVEKLKMRVERYEPMGAGGCQRRTSFITAVT